MPRPCGSEFADLSPADQASFDPLATSLRGYLLAQIALGLLGGLVITSEYGARTIVPTLIAVPHRARVLVSKAVVLVGVVLPVGIAVSLAGFLVGQASLSGAGAPHLALSDGVALRGIVGGGLYLALAGLFGLALGTVIRSTTATVTTLFGVMLIVQAFAPALPAGVGDWVSKYWPPIMRRADYHQLSGPHVAESLGRRGRHGRMCGGSDDGGVRRLPQA